MVSEQCRLIRPLRVESDTVMPCLPGIDDMGAVRREVVCLDNPAHLDLVRQLAILRGSAVEIGASASFPPPNKMTWGGVN
jgi:hypothetical protein